MTPDRRLNPARADLASLDLEGIVRARRFAEPLARRVIAPSAMLRADSGLLAVHTSQVIFGERFDVVETQGPFVWGQARRDGYVGWLAAEALSSETPEPTHRVIALRTFAFADPSIKSAPFGPLSLNAMVTITQTIGGLSQALDAGWIPTAHLAPIGEAFAEPASTAERFLGTPYLWGGRDSVGLDCSGLVQQAFWSAGMACPRDADQQSHLGLAVAPEALERGDLVFWSGHVGMMLDASRLIHANAHHMAVAIEPLTVVIARTAAKEGVEPIGYRRRVL